MGLPFTGHPLKVSSPSACQHIGSFSSQAYEETQVTCAIPFPASQQGGGRTGKELGEKGQGY